MEIEIENERCLTLKEAFDRFQRQNRIKNLAEETMTFYQNSYNNFVQFIGDEGTEISKIKKETISNYILSLKEKIKDTSINTYLRGIRTFLYYCMDENMLDKFKIKGIKVDKKKKEGYSTSQLKKLLNKPDMTSFGEYRNWVIIQMLLATGCRSKTLLNIKIKDIDLEECYVKFRKTKQKREQILPLTSTMIDSLSEYLAIREGEKDDYLFPTVYGNQLSRSGLTNAIRTYNKKRGVSDTSIHKFRHTFSKIFMRNGGSIYELKQILGHKEISTTENYVNLLLEDYNEDFSTKNPLEIISGNKTEIKIKD